MRRSRLRARIEALSNARCEYCQAPQNACGYHFHLEHIVPVILGGGDEESNRALACATCNLVNSGRVSALDPLTGEGTSLFHPRNQRWHEHFQWAEDQRTLLGRTSAGRAVIICLDMNNEIRQRARAFWFAAGLLP